MKNFLSTRGIKEGIFYYWRKKYGEKKERIMPENKSGFAMIEVTPATEKASTDKLFAEVARIRIYQAVAAPCLKAFAVGYPDSHVVTPENIICTDMKKGFNSLCGIITSKLGFANTITKYTKIS